jgi:hypothetical protein
MCYDLANANFTEDISEGFGNMKKDYPDVVIVKKHYPRMRRKHRKRWWKLDRIPKVNEEDIEEEEPDITGVKPKKRKTKKAIKKSKHKSEHDDKKEFEDFLQDLEEDPELRSTMNLYKNKKVMEELEAKMARVELGDNEKEMARAGMRDNIKKIAGVNKLDKNKKVLKAKRKTQAGEDMQKEKAENESKTKLYMQAIKDEDESDVEEDFPAVNLEELMDNLKLDDEKLDYDQLDHDDDKLDDE